MLFEDKILVKQRKTSASFFASDYFPFVGDVVTLSNTSIESDINLWTLNDGTSGVTTTASTLGVNINIAEVRDAPQLLETSNDVSVSSLGKSLYPTYTLDCIYADIIVDKEVIRKGEIVNFSAKTLNNISGVIPTFVFNVYRQNETIPYVSYSAQSVVHTFNDTGIFDVELIVDTTGNSISRIEKKIITVTHALQPLSAATSLVIHNGYNYYNLSSYSAGTTLVLTKAAGYVDDIATRVRLENATGTTENPIIITVSGNTQFEIKGNDYWTLYMQKLRYVIIDGRGYENLEYGLHLTKAPSADTCQMNLQLGTFCSDVHLVGVECSFATFTGLSNKTDPKSYDQSTWRGNCPQFNNWIEHHNLFRDTTSEGNYIGYFNNQPQMTIIDGKEVYYLPHQFIDAKVYRNKFYRIGWDALQLNNGGGFCEICYNIFYSAATFPVQDQATFMSIVLDGEVYNNTLINSGGLGMQFGSVSGISLYNNILTKLGVGQATFIILSTNMQTGNTVNYDNTGTTFQIYNNSTSGTGPFIQAQNVMQYYSVYVRNNLIKYGRGDGENEIYMSGQGDDAYNQWVTNSLNEQGLNSNVFITDGNGVEFNVADLIENDFRISSRSPLVDNGMEFGKNFDHRGFYNWNESGKWTGAYSAYRKSSITGIRLINYYINSTGTTKLTTDRTVTLYFTANDTVIEYIASEDSSFIGASYSAVTSQSAITYTISSIGEGSKTIYFKVKNADNIVSQGLSDTIEYSTFNTFNIDIGSTNFETSNYNNLSYVEGVEVPTGVTSNIYIDSVGGTGYTYNISVSAAFSRVGSNGDNIDGIFCATANRDSFLVCGSSVGELTFNNLCTSRCYDMEILGNKSFLSENNIYTVCTDGYCSTQPLEGCNNVTNTASFFNFCPNFDGTTMVQVSLGSPSGTDYAAISAIRLKECTIE